MSSFRSVSPEKVENHNSKRKPYSLIQTNKQTKKNSLQQYCLV